MKIVLSIIASLFSVVSAGQWVELNQGIRADSEAGMELLSKARRLDDGDYQQTWVSGYSIKFQGCHHISQWNNDVEDEDDVRIMTKRLVRFRLCPTDSCSSSNTAGCNEGYGDYIIDLNTYLYYYFVAKQTYQQFQCEYLANYVCQCNNNNNGNGQQEYCMYDCFAEHNMADICMDGNPYNNGNGNGNYYQNFALEDYMYCSKSGISDANGNSIYIGPYCASQGGAIYLGGFSDEDCTVFADTNGGRDTFSYAAGMDLPYGDANVVDMDCLSCKEPGQNNNAGNDANDGDDVADVCENLYTRAGKCEEHMSSSYNSYPNNYACNYMEGIKIVRKDGTVITADAKANKTAAVFIGLFTVAFVLLSAYVYYLKTRLDRASINLAE